MSSRETVAIGLMANFAERTGLTSHNTPKRYLWTDAFALYNWVELYRKSRDECYRDVAVKLIDQVHHVLGRHRPDDWRAGWLSGLPEEEGRRHPTLGGLRIGKPLPERRPDEPLDDRTEWDRDGQYFHYLTKWMDALVRAALILKVPPYLIYAAELAEAIFDPFLQSSADGQPTGLHWKMSVDLSRPLVASVNPHDALDGYVTYRLVGDYSADRPSDGLKARIRVLGDLCTRHTWGTSDPLGIGGLLVDALRLVSLPDKRTSDRQLLAKILAGAEIGIQHLLASDPLNAPPDRRLAFRELGLAIGLQTLPGIESSAKHSGMLSESTQASIRLLKSVKEVERAIVACWSAPESWKDLNWQDHRDINCVMLATALLHPQLQIDTIH